LFFFHLIFFKEQKKHATQKKMLYTQSFHSPLGASSPISKEIKRSIYNSSPRWLKRSNELDNLLLEEDPKPKRLGEDFFSSENEEESSLLTRCLDCDLVWDGNAQHTCKKFEKKMKEWKLRKKLSQEELVEQIEETQDPRDQEEETQAPKDKEEEEEETQAPEYKGEEEETQYSEDEEEDEILLTPVRRKEKRPLVCPGAPKKKLDRKRRRSNDSAPSSPVFGSNEKKEEECDEDKDREETQSYALSSNNGEKTKEELMKHAMFVYQLECESVMTMYKQAMEDIMEKHFNRMERIIKNNL
jgi:hypothetical protein